MRETLPEMQVLRLYVCRHIKTRKTGCSGAGRGIVVDIRTLFPNASRDTIALNRQTSRSNPEQFTREKPLGIDQGKAENTRRCILSYTSRRCRLLDEDNWCTKYFTDALRYCGALSNDTPDKVTIQVRQEKVSKRSEEETIIELEY
jgi:hypothetical protein